MCAWRRGTFYRSNCKMKQFKNESDSSWTAWPLKMGPKRRVETSVTTNNLCRAPSHKKVWTTPWLKPETSHRQVPLNCTDVLWGRTAPLTSKVAIYIFIHQIHVPNILNMVYTIRFFFSSWCLFHNSNVFGSCIIHTLYTGCAKIKKKIIPAPKG